MSAIAAFRTAVLAMLDDATNVRFTSAQVDQSIRSALKEYSLARPLVQTYSYSGVGLYVIELPADFQPIKIIGVELHDDSMDPQIELPFYAFKRDSQWCIELTTYLLPPAKSIDITYTTIHTIDGLDAAAGTTLPAEDEPALHLGAAGYATLFRAVSRSESVNLQPKVQKQLMEISAVYTKDFRAAIKRKPGASFGSMPAVPTDRF